MPRRKTSARGIVLLGFAFAAALVACAGPSPSTPGTNNAVARPAVAPGQTPHAWGRVSAGIGGAKIQHVVFVIQENRSFDNIFGGLDNKGKPFPGADTVSNPNPGEPTPENHLGQPVAMATGLLEDCYDPYHDHGNSVQDVDGGKMNGFDQEGVVQESCAPSPAPTNYVYRTIEYNEVEPYWLMGEQYAVSDRMFEPFSSGSYGPHLYVVSGQSAHTIDNPSATPWGCDAPTDTVVPLLVDYNDGETGGVFPCFAVPTLGDVMDQRGVSWRFYAAGTPQHDFGYFWSAYDSFNDIRNGPDWTTKIVNPPAQIITDVENGTLAAMTWVTPLNATSDHPQAHSNEGPAWIVSVVNAIGQSKFWDSTAIFVTWDDWGGWYDHVPPPVTGPASLGIRVPVIVISPYARNGYVSHVTHTTGSILHFAEEAFNLPSLGEEDAREDDFSDTFNFSQTPTPFTPFTQSKKQKAEIMRAASESRDGAGERDNEAKVGD
jgi:phospholipase C